MVVISYCDDLVNWNTVFGTHELDMVDLIEGIASIKVTGDGTPWNWIQEWYDPAGVLNLTPYSHIRLKIKPQVLQDLRFQLFTDWANLFEWDLSNPKYGILPNQWNEVVLLGLRMPDEVVGSPSLSSIDFLSVRMHQPAGGEAFWIDVISAESVLLNYHTLSVASAPSGIPFVLEASPGGIVMNLATPWSSSLQEGIVKLTVPQSFMIGGIAYYFSKWDDGSTNPVRSIVFTSNISASAIYVARRILTVNSNLSGVSFTVKKG